MEDLMMDCIDCLTDCIEFIDDPKMRQHILNTIRMAEGRLEYQALIRNEAHYNF
jgi:hypothetical protein